MVPGRRWFRTSGSAALAGVPLLRRPGQAFLRNAGSDVQGVLVVRAAGRGLPEFLAERVFEPLGLTDGCLVRCLSACAWCRIRQRSSRRDATSGCQSGLPRTPLAAARKSVTAR
ncbi:serine hydrolase [Streptomyces sp. NPDC005538]|uniref:serine hydrolase n=1 Tax=Streptomyces sp. NPDC005538 TaxID=3157043 RepID=UPI0033A80BBF